MNPDQKYGNDPDLDLMFQFFSYAHLPEHLQAVSKPFHDLAKEIIEKYPPNPERTAGLRNLLLAKDCIIRATIFKWPISPEGKP